MASEAAIEVQGLKKSFGDVRALCGIDLHAPAGNNVWGAVLWSLGLIVVFAPLAVRRYRRTVST